MDYQSLIDTLSPDIVARLRLGIETGRWPDGQAVTPEQREHSLRAVIAWEQQHLPEDQRVGYIDKGSKADRGTLSAGQREQELRWVDQSAGDKQ
ncbi:MAG: YeaC family protein [Congregibacter sp.]|nr:YeaC family protein [Congregibacter sp.]MDP5070607.1 YeaC family protein [Congregibacter sp.]